MDSAIGYFAAAAGCIVLLFVILYLRYRFDKFCEESKQNEFIRTHPAQPDVDAFIKFYEPTILLDNFDAFSVAKNYINHLWEQCDDINLLRRIPFTKETKSHREALRMWYEYRKLFDLDGAGLMRIRGSEELEDFYYGGMPIRDFRLKYPLRLRLGIDDIDGEFRNRADLINLGIGDKMPETIRIEHAYAWAPSWYDKWQTKDIPYGYARMVDYAASMPIYAAQIIIWLKHYDPERLLALTKALAPCAELDIGREYINTYPSDHLTLSLDCIMISKYKQGTMIDCRLE